jgi:flagellar biosynthetic protein FlhB
MAEYDGEKSQEPTPHRRQEAREKGQVAQSHDLVSAALLIAASGTLIALGGHTASRILRLVNVHLGGPAWQSWGTGDFYLHWQSTALEVAAILVPLFTAVFVCGVVIQLAQVGFLFLPERLSPDISRIDPIKGFQRIFSLSGFVRLLFGILKIVAVGVLGFLILYRQRYEIMSLTGLEVGQIASFLGEVSLWTCLKIGVALLVLAILDYGYQFWKREQDLKMTPQEIRDEMKNLQGDPKIIARRRVVQRQLALNRLASAVPTRPTW